MATTHEITRMTGLASGLDIESLVKAGTANTKNSLDKRKQKLQTLQWKHEHRVLFFHQGKRCNEEQQG